MNTTATNPGATMRNTYYEPRPTNTQPAHCRDCGSTDYEDLYGPDSDQGYTACCNKSICHGDGCRNCSN